jgi:4-amino-4-deoxy-L-arabinose transferase-like glycosyltransferase
LTEREWREASDMRPSRVGLAAVLLTAAVLRFYALDHGISSNLDVEESQIQKHAVQMMKNGSLNPRGFFEYPSLFLYVQTGVATARFLAGAVVGRWSALGQVGIDDFYVWSRTVTAALGLATVLLVFNIGMRWGARPALLASGLLAVLPLHVQQSHHVLTPIPLTFLTTLTLLLTLRAHERGTVAAFALAGAACGFAMATQYVGVIVLSVPLTAAWMTTGAKSSRARLTLAIVGSWFAAFLLGAPYTVLDLPGFLNGFARVAGDRSALPVATAWSTNLSLLRQSFGWPALFLTLVGFVLALNRLVRGPGRVRWALVTLFPVLYVALVSSRRLALAPYLLPIMPTLCLLVATAVISGVSLLRRYEIPRAPRTALIAALTVAALLPPAVKSIAYAREIALVSTVDQAHSWVLANIPKGSTVLVEAGVLRLDEQGYRNTTVQKLIVDPETGSPREHAAYVAEGVDYLIASSQSFGAALSTPQHFPDDFVAYMRIFEQSRELVRFTPSAQHPGPELRIYKVR